MAAPPTTQIAAEKAAFIASYCASAKTTSYGWSACCPAHDDKQPSLSISYEGDTILLHCHTGCSVQAICAAINFPVADLFCGEKKGRHPIIATYDYVDEHGTLLFQACRLSNKSFFQRQPTAGGGWTNDIKGVRRVLYHLPEVLAAVARRDEPIYIVEGEKDVESLRMLGLTATCNPMGAGKWSEDAYAHALYGADCILLPDYDQVGADHMSHVARQLYELTRTITIVPGIHTGKKGSDVSDWLAAGGTREQLETIVQATPLTSSAPPLNYRLAAPPTNNGTHPQDAPAPPGGFDVDRLYTDSYNARALIEAHGKNLRYCYPWKSWLVWRGTHWQRDTSGEVMRLAKTTIKNLARLLPGLDDKQAFALLGHIKSSLANAKLKAMIESAQSEEGVAVQPEELDRDLFLLNVVNGTIDLRTGNLQDAARDDLITKCLSVPFNPHATCPTWEAFLKRVMGDKQGLVAFLHRAIGYSLTGSTIEQCLFILHGPTKTGKTTFLARLRALLGPYSTQADMESFMHKERQEVRNDLADLAGARVVCAVEAQEGRRLNESLIKQLTGGLDQVKARFLFEEYFTYTPQYKVFLGTNHKPVIKDNDQAIWERIRLVPFIVQIPTGERRKTFDAELHKEIEGILAWAVDGCLKWQHDKGLKEPPEVIQATDAYKDEMDVIGRFIKEKAEVEVNAQAPAKEFYEAYKAWCEENGERWETLSKFGVKMTERGYEKKISAGVKYLGIKLKPPGTPPPAPTPPVPPEPGTEDGMPF